MKKSSITIVVCVQLLAGHAYTNAADKQGVVNTITKAAHAYWAQRAVVQHAADGALYGYSGRQTVVDPANPADRYYDSDHGFIPEPHIFQEWEDSPGHPSVGFAFLRGYEATGDKFLLRAAKELGDTLLSAQKDLGVGGWWQDMGIVAYDRRDGSPTYRQTVDFGRWMNLSPWSGHGNIEITTINGKEYNVQGVANFDGCSYLAGYYLLKLYQAIPAEDADRDKYLQGAQWLADEIAGFKDVVDAEAGFHPYGRGGTPQLWPYNVMKNRAGYQAPSSYPYPIPHNAMVTLNDDAMTGTLSFLMEFWKEARSNPALYEAKYLEAIRLNMDYLMDVFDAVANANGRSAWASFYWINDGSARANKPTWGRSYEPPGIGFNEENADEALLAWYRYETGTARKTRIENTLRNFLLYFKYDAPAVNSRPEWRDVIRPYIRNGQYIDNYDPANPETWWWWLWYNHDESAAPRGVFVGSGDTYQAYYGADALVEGHNHDDHYPMIRNRVGRKINNTLTSSNGLYLFDAANPGHNSILEYHYRLVPEIRILRGWESTESRVTAAMNLLNENTGFFTGSAGLNSLVMNNKTYYYVEDMTFQINMRYLAWGAENGTGTLTDSDGDGHTDAAEIAAGTDVHDSEYYPGHPAPSDQTAPGVPQGLSAQAASASRIDLSWGASSDNVRTTGYKVHRNGQWVATVFRPGYSDTGLSSNTPYAYMVSAHDAAGNESAPSSVVNVSTTDTGNHTPVLATIGNRSVDEGQTITFAISATDADPGDTLTYSASNLPTGAGFNPAARTFTWTPSNGESGNHQVVFRVNDGQVYASETITITVNNVDNHPPVLAAIGNKSVNENGSLSFSVSATDPDGDGLTYSATGLPSGASFANRVFSWIPNYDQAGSYSVTFTVSDGGLTDSEQITIAVANVSDQTPPSAQAVYPAADAIQVPLNPLITLNISDSGLGIDASTAAIRVNNQLVYSGDSSLYDSAYGVCRRMGTRSSYRYYYHPTKLFNCDEQVTVHVTASDAAHNAMTPVSYQFVTEMQSFGRNQPVSSAGAGNGHPALATDSQGDIWAVWHAGQANSRNIYVAKRGSQTQLWDTPVQLTNLASDECNPVIAVGPNDALYVAWQDNRRGNWDIYVSVRPAADTWHDPVRVTDTDDNQTNPAIAIDHAATPVAYLAWQDDGAGNQEIYLASSSTLFASKQSSRITSQAADQTGPALAVGPDNTVYLVWTDQRNGTADVYGSSSSVLSWANTQIAVGPGNQQDPAVAVEPGASVLHLLWVNDAGGNPDIFYGTSNGLPSSPLAGRSIVDDSTAAAQSAPVIVAVQDHQDDTHMYACWLDNRVVGNSRDADLYLAEIRSGAGGTNILVGDDATNSNQSGPALGFDEYGLPAVLWADDRSGTTRIYSACSTYFKPVILASAPITRSAGGRVGTDPAAIDDVRDVSIQIPATAGDCDSVISISEIRNLPGFAAPYIAGFEFGPSGMQFAFPATVTIPYAGSSSGRVIAPYWYDAQTGTLSQQGITAIANTTLANGMSAVSFKTTHLTPFYILEGTVPTGGGGGGGGGGGCALSHSHERSTIGYVFPYGALVLLMLVLKWRDRRHRDFREAARRGCSGCH